MYKRPDSLPYGVTEYNLAAPDVLARPTEDPISKESQTTLRETIYRHISILLSRGQRFNGADLYKTFSSYNNTLLTQDLGRVQQSLSDHSASEPLGRPLRTDLDVASEFSYAIARLIQPADFDTFSQAEIHFTDDYQTFKQYPHQKRTQSRGRHYVIH